MDPEAQRDAWDGFYRREGRVWRGRGLLDLSPRPGTRALDIGCGNGKSSGSLLEAGCILTGIDHSAAAIAICKERFPEGRFMLADARRLPFLDRSFDLVLMVHVLDHLDSEGRREAMEEAWRVLDEGGEIHVLSFGRDDLRYGQGESGDEDHSFLRKGIRYHYMDEEALISLIPPGCEAGWEEERMPVRFASGERVRWRLSILRPSIE